jgi:hypothetical protein
MKHSLLLLSILLSGCSLTTELENRLAVTLACDETLIVSKYGPWGVSSTLSPKDHKAIAKNFCGN